LAQAFLFAEPLQPSCQLPRLCALRPSLSRAGCWRRGMAMEVRSDPVSRVEHPSSAGARQAQASDGRVLRSDGEARAAALAAHLGPPATRPRPLARHLREESTALGASLRLQMTARGFLLGVLLGAFAGLAWGQLLFDDDSFEAQVIAMLAGGATGALLLGLRNNLQARLGSGRRGPLLQAEQAGAFPPRLQSGALPASILSHGVTDARALHLALQEQRAIASRLISALPTHRATAAEVDAAPEECKGCIICMEDFREGDEQRTLPCFHRFHAACVDPWLHRHCTCPICKHRIDCDVEP